jgi:hypothetical protein
MSNFQSFQDERHERETDPRRLFGPTVERLPLVLVSFGIGLIVLAALLFGGAVGVVASLVIEALILLVTVPLTLLLVLGIARMTGTYFGTLGQAIVRLASFLVVSQGLLVVVSLGLLHFGDYSVAIVVLLACLGLLFWLFGALFDLDPMEMMVTFKVIVIFACALIFQSLVFVGLRAAYQLAQSL